MHCFIVMVNLKKKKKFKGRDIFLNSYTEWELVRSLEMMFFGGFRTFVSQDSFIMIRCRNTKVSYSLHHSTSLNDIILIICVYMCAHRFCTVCVHEYNYTCMSSHAGSVFTLFKGFSVTLCVQFRFIKNMYSIRMQNIKSDLHLTNWCSYCVEKLTWTKLMLTSAL